MKKISSEEFDKLLLHGKGRSSPFFDAVYNLKVEEAFIISKEEWKHKFSPSYIVRKIEKKYGTTYKVGALGDRTGWAVKRLS